MEKVRSYLERVEPTVPRISLGGRQPEEPVSFDAWKTWKTANGLREYDYRTVFTPGGENPCETLISKNRR